MFEKHFEALCARYEELLLSSHQNEVILDLPRYRRVLTELSRLEPAVQAWRRYQELARHIAEAEELREDPDFRAEAAAELGVSQAQISRIEKSALQKLRKYMT